MTKCPTCNRAMPKPRNSKARKLPKQVPAHLNGAVPFSREAWELLTHKVFGGVCGGRFFNCECAQYRPQFGAIAQGPNIAEPAPEIDVEVLEMCVCGHKASEHAQDKLENYLRCSYNVESNGPNDCHCDHFRMAVKEAA